MSRIRRLAKFRNKRTAYEAPKFGFNPHLDEGTDGDWFVDGINGNDLNNGTSIQTAFKTIGKAVSVMSGGQVVRIAAGTYREGTFDLGTKNGTPGNPTVFAGYKDQKPVITGAEVITGWVQCTISDQANVGSNYANVYKKVINTSEFASASASAAFLHENGEMCYLASERNFDPKYPMLENDTKQFMEAEQVNVVATKIISYKKTSITDKYTKTQLDRAKIWFHYSPNANAATTITFDDVNKLMVLTDQTRVYATGDVAANKFALFNILPNIKQGEWGYINNLDGAGTTTLFIWPRNVANLTNRIEYSKRSKCFWLGSEGHDFEIKSLIIRQYSSSGVSYNDEYPIYAGSVSGTGVKSNIMLSNLLIKNNYRDDGADAPIIVRGCSNFRAKNITVSWAINQFGIMLDGAANNVPAYNAWVDSCYVEYSASAAIRFYNQRNFVASFVRTADCGLAAHSNKSNMYVEAHDFMWYGCDFSGSSGYLTWQDASGASVVNCYIPVNYNSADGRAIYDQNRSIPTIAEKESIDSTGYILNNTIVPYRESITLDNSFRAGQISSSASWITNISGNGTTVTCTTGSANTFATNDFVAISGTVNFNGIYQVTNTGSTSFTFPSAVVATETTGFAAEKNVTSINGNGTTATVTTSPAHSFTTGDFINITGTTNFNGFYTITVVNTTQFTFSHAYVGTDNTGAAWWNRLVYYKVYNNVLHGSQLGSKWHSNGNWGKNYYTIGTTIDATDTLSSVSATYENPIVGNFTLKADAPLRSLSGKDVSTEINILKAKFPFFTHWDKDITKTPNSMNWTSPKIGCASSYESKRYFTPKWIQYPLFDGTSLVGEPVQISEGYLAADPYPTWNYQWQTSSDNGVTWNNIGSTSSQYTISANDAGKQIGCLITTGELRKRIVAQVPVAASYPIGNPIVLNSVSQTQTMGAGFKESGTFTSDGTPIMVVVSWTSGSTDDTCPVTIGPNGTESSLTSVGYFRRIDNHSQIFWIQNPSAGTVKVRATPTQNWDSIRIDTFKVSGLASFGTIVSAGATNVGDRTPTVTTTKTNSLVLYIINRFEGENVTNSISWSGATELVEGNSGGTGTTYINVSIAFEKAQTIGIYKAVASWSTVRSVGHGAIELKSA